MSDLVAASYALLVALRTLGINSHPHATIYLDGPDFEMALSSLTSTAHRPIGDVGVIKGERRAFTVNGIMFRKRIWSRK